MSTRVRALVPDSQELGPMDGWMVSETEEEKREREREKKKKDMIKQRGSM